MGSGNLRFPAQNNFYETAMQKDQFQLPAGVREKHGSWHFVHKHKWTKLCRIEDGRFQLYLKLKKVGAIASDTVWYAILSYLEHGMEDLAEETKLGYRGAGMRMVHHFGHYHLMEVEPTHCKQYLVWCKANNRGTSGNREKALMSSVWEYAMGEGWVSSNPWRGVRRNKERKNRRYVEHATLTQEINRSPPQLMSLYGVAYLLGIRQTDLRLAKESQLFEVVENKVQKLKLKVIESKTGKENEHEITATVGIFLRMAADHKEACATRYEASALKLEKGSYFKKAEKRRLKAVTIRKSEHIFLSERGLPWSKWALQSALRRFRPAFRFRDLRSKAQTDSEKNILGHGAQMREFYTKKRKLAAVK